ncbi:MAG: diaminopimelate epimerase [Deltaproteobacteria bacterium]|nr:MAG: diaminopimelate epimerase [Deltaproteobacteria bacterium]
MRFFKYHGLGNDFVVVDLRAAQRGDGPWPEDPPAVRALCDRRFGVGADGVLPILPPQADGAHARMRVLNADGSEAEMCGNGIRCVAKHLYERDPALRTSPLRIDTGAGTLACAVDADGGTVTAVAVDMGRPRLQRGDIPMTGPASERCVAAPLDVEGRAITVTAVSMGNPHAVAFVPETGPALRALAERVGPAIERHAWFPNRTNVEFAHVHAPDAIELVVWERGCGITLACGTGACATVVAACLEGHCRPGGDVAVSLLGGTLHIRVAGDYSGVRMRGPATHVFDGDIDLAALDLGR